MASFSFTFPAAVANFLNLNVPGFAGASGGGNTVVLQVPAAAVPAPVVAGLNNAGIQVAPAADAAAAPAAAAAPVAGAAAAPVGGGGGAFGLSQFAPAGLVPQGDALANPQLAGANAAAQGLAASNPAAPNQAGGALFQALAANPSPADPAQFGAWVTQQQQAVSDYLFGA